MNYFGTATENRRSETACHIMNSLDKIWNTGC